MKFLVAFFLFFFLISCTSKQKVPEGVLPVPKLSAVMWDVMQADAVVSRRYSADTSLKRFDTSIQLYRQIFQAHHTSAEQFKKSIRFYEARPDLLQIIFDSLQRRAEAPADSTKHLSPV